MSDPKTQQLDETRTEVEAALAAEQPKPEPKPQKPAPAAKPEPKAKAPRHKRDVQAQATIRKIAEAGRIPPGPAPRKTKAQLKAELEAVQKANNRAPKAAPKPAPKKGVRPNTRYEGSIAQQWDIALEKGGTIEALAAQLGLKVSVLNAHIKYRTQTQKKWRIVPGRGKDQIRMIPAA